MHAELSHYAKQNLLSLYKILRKNVKQWCYLEESVTTKTVVEEQATEQVRNFEYRLFRL